MVAWPQPTSERKGSAPPQNVAEAAGAGFGGFGHLDLVCGDDFCVTPVVSLAARGC